MPIEFELNGAQRRFDGDADMPLLWYLRDHAGLSGTKFGCGIGSCGACSVHVDGRVQRSCVTPLASVANRSIRTIEGLASAGKLHPVQRAWLELDVAQCGYCQAGQIMAAVDLLAHNPQPDDAAIAAIGNICRCGTYPRIRQAIRRAAVLSKEETP